jgi:hypothetical protein
MLQSIIVVRLELPNPNPFGTNGGNEYLRQNIRAKINATVSSGEAHTVIVLSILKLDLPVKLYTGFALPMSTMFRRETSESQYFCWLCCPYFKA